MKTLVLIAVIAISFSQIASAGTKRHQNPKPSFPNIREFK